MTSKMAAGIPTSALSVIAIILAFFTPSVAPQQPAPCPTLSCAGTVSVGTLIGSCFAVLIGTLLVELGIYMCYRYWYKNNCNKLTASNSDISTSEEDGLPQRKDYHAASWIFRGPKPKEKQRASVFSITAQPKENSPKTSIYNISEAKEDGDKVMFSPGLYRTSLEPKHAKSKRKTANVLVNSADNYQPEFPTIYSYNNTWDNTVEHILNKHGKYDRDDASMVSIDLDDDQEFPILKAPKDGVGSIDFTSAKFGIHNRGFSHSPDSISLSESEKGDVSTFRYITGVSGKMRHGMSKESIISNDFGRSNGRKEHVIDMEWDDYADPDTRITIDDNFQIGPPSAIITSDYDSGLEQPDSSKTFETYGNFILRKSEPPARVSDSSDEDLYDYGESDTERKKLAEKHTPWTSSFSRAHYKAKMGKVTLERDIPPSENEMPDFGSRFRYSTGFRGAKSLAMRAAGAPVSREKDVIIRRQREEALAKAEPIKLGYIKLVRSDTPEEIQPSPEPCEDQEPQVVGQIKLVRPEMFDRTIYKDTQFRLAPAPQHEDEDDDLMVLYPISSKDGTIKDDNYHNDHVCKSCRSRERMTRPRDISAQAIFESEHLSTISSDTTESDTKKEEDEDLDAIGVIRLIEPYDYNTMSSTSSKKTVRFEDEENPKLPPDSVKSSTSSDSYAGITTTDEEVNARRSSDFVRATSRSSKRGSRDRRKRRSKSVPVRRTHLDEQQQLGTIGTIRLVSPDRTSDFSSDRGYASQTSVARLLFDEPDVMDTDDVETIGVLRLVSPQTSPRPVRSERMQQQRSRKSTNNRVRSPDSRSAGQTFDACLSFDEPDVMDTDDVETIGVLRLVSPQTSPRPVRSERMQQQRSRKTAKDIVRSPDARSAGQTFDASLSFDEHVMDTDDVETIGVLRLVSPQTSPRPVRSERMQQQRSRKPTAKRTRSPGGRNSSQQSPERRVKSLDRNSTQQERRPRSPEKRAKSLDRNLNNESNHTRHEVRNRSLEQRRSPRVRSPESPVRRHRERSLSPGKTLGYVKLVSPKTKRRVSGHMRDATTEPHVPWIKLLRRLQECVEEEHARKVARREARDVGTIKLRRPVGLVKHAGTQPEKTWFEIMQDMEDVVDAKYRQSHTSTPVKSAKEQDLQQSPVSNNVGTIKLQTPMPRRNVRDQASQPDFSWRQMMSEFEDEIKSSIRLQHQQPTQAIIKLQQAPVKDLKPDVPLTKSRGSQSLLPWGALVSKIRDDAMEEYHKMTEREQQQVRAKKQKEPTVFGVFKIKGAKDRSKHDSYIQMETMTEEQQAVPVQDTKQTKSRGSQSQHPWDTLVRKIQDDALEEYREDIHREYEEQIANERKDPTLVSVVKIKGAKDRPKLDGFTQSETVSTDEHTTEPDRSWDAILKDMKRILENEYRRTITELETRLVERPKDETDFGKIATPVAVFKLKSRPPEPEPTTTATTAFTQCETPQMTDHVTEPDRSWSGVVKDVREILENEYRRTIQELEDRLTEPDNKSAPIAVFKLKERIKTADPVEKPQMTTSGTQADKPWGDILSTMKESVENEYKQIIRDLQSQLETSKEEPPQPKTLGFFKIPGKPKEIKPKAAKKEKATGPLFPWSTVVRNMEHRLGSKLKKQMQYEQIDEEPKPKQLGVITLKSPKPDRINDDVELEELDIPKNLGIITLKSPKLSSKNEQIEEESSMIQEVVEVTERSTSPVQEIIVPEQVNTVEATLPFFGMEIGVQVDSKVVTSDFGNMCRPTTIAVGSSTVPPLLINQFSQSQPAAEAQTGTQVKPDYTDFSHQEMPAVRHVHTSVSRGHLLSLSPMEITSKEPEAVVLTGKPAQTPIDVITKESCTQVCTPMIDAVAQYECNQTSVNIQVSPATRNQNIETIQKQLLTVAVQLDPILQKNFQIQASPEVSDNDTMTLQKVTKDSSTYSYSDDIPSEWKQTQTTPNLTTQGMITEAPEGLMASTQTIPQLTCKWTQYEMETLDNWVQVAAIQRHGETQTGSEMPQEEDIVPIEVHEVKSGQNTYLYDSDSGVDTKTQTEPVMIVADMFSDTDIEVMDSISQTEPGVFMTESEYSDEDIELSDINAQEQFTGQYQTEIIRATNVQVLESTPPIPKLFSVDADAQTYTDVKHIYAQTKPPNVRDSSVHVTADTQLAQTQTQEIKKSIAERQSQTSGIEQIHQGSNTDLAKKSYTFVQTDVKLVSERAVSPINIDVKTTQAQTESVNSEDRGINVSTVSHLAQTQTEDIKKRVVESQSQTQNIRQIDQSSSTMPPQHSASFVQTDTASITDRAVSPINTPVVNRASSPIQTKVVHTGCDPIMASSKESAIQVSSTSRDESSQYIADVKAGRTQTSPKLTRHQMSATETHVDNSWTQTIDEQPVEELTLTPIDVSVIDTLHAMITETHPVLADQYTETQQVPAFDFATQVKPLTIEQTTATEIVPQVTSETQVAMSERKPSTHDIHVQHQPKSGTYDTSIQVEPMTFNQGTTTPRLVRYNVGVQATTAIEQQQPTLAHTVSVTSDIGTSMRVESSEIMTQTRVPLSETGVQVTHTIRSSSVATSAKPTTLDHTATAKPDVVEMTTQATPIQRNEGSQCQRAEQVDMTSQYENLVSEDTSVQVKPVIRDQASSPICQRKDINVTTQTDLEDEEMMELFGEEEIIRSAELIMSASEGVRFNVDQSTQADQHKPLSDTSTQVTPVTLNKITETFQDNRPKSTQVSPSTYERGTSTQALRSYDRMTQAGVETVASSTSPHLTDTYDVGIQHDANEPVAQIEPTVEPVQMAQVHASMTPSYATTEKIQLRDEVKEEVRLELRNEVREELRQEVRADVRMEIQHDVRQSVRRDLERDVRKEMTFIIREELQDDVRQSVRSGLEKEVRNEMTCIIRDELREDVRHEMRREFESRIRFEMEDRHRSDMEYRLRGELEPLIRLEMEPVIRQEVEKDLRKQTSSKPVRINQGTSTMKEIVYSKPTQTSLKTTSRGTHAEKPPAINALTQVKPSTFDRGSSPLDTLVKEMWTQALIPVEDKITQFDSETATRTTDVNSLPGAPLMDQVTVFSQTEIEQSNESTQATTIQKISSTQYESLHSVDRTLQVQPMMINQKTSMSPIPPRKEFAVQSKVDQTDNFVQHEISHTHRDVQIAPETREEASSPICKQYTQDRSTSPYKQPEADYTPPGLDKLRSNRPTRLTLVTRKSPKLFSPDENKSLVIEEDIKPIESQTYTHSIEPNEELSLESRALSPTTQNLFSRLDHSLQSRTRDESPQRLSPSKQYTYTFTRYDDEPVNTKETYISRYDRDSQMSSPQLTSTPTSVATRQSRRHVDSTYNILPPGTQVVVVQTKSPEYTTAVISDSSSIVTSSLSLSRGRPTAFTSLSPILSSRSSISDGENELDHIRKDLRLSQVIITTDDPVRLVHFLLNPDLYPHKQQLPRYTQRYTPMETSMSALFNDTSHHTSDYHHADYSRITSYKTCSSRSLLQISNTSTSSMKTCLDSTPSFRLRVPHDSKGSPGPGIRMSPPRAISPVPPRITPEEIAKLPIPRGMVTRLSDLLDADGNPRNTSSMIPTSPIQSVLIQDLVDLFNSYDDIDNFFSSDKKDQGSDSEADTHDSDTDSENWEAVLDLTMPYSSYSDLRYSSDEMDHQSISSEDSVSDDDDISVSCTYNLVHSYQYDPIVSSDDEYGSSFKRRKPKTTIDSKKLREELELSEVAISKSPTVKLTGYYPNEAERPDLRGPYNLYRSLNRKKRTRSEPDIMALIRDDQSIPGSPTPSIVSGHTSDRLKDTMSVVNKDGAEYVPKFAQIRHTSLVRTRQMTTSSTSIEARSRYTKLSQSEPDLALSRYGLSSRGSRY